MKVIHLNIKHRYECLSVQVRFLITFMWMRQANKPCLAPTINKRELDESEYVIWDS